jgi:hypothetical protein
MPVHAEAFGKLVLDDEPDAVPFIDLNRRPRHAAVEAPRVDDASRDELSTHMFDGDVEHLHAIVETPRHVRDIG